MRKRPEPVTGGDELIAVAQLRRDVDLGLHMAERLMLMGEVGAARGIIAELAGETERTAKSMPARVRSRVRRSAIVTLSVAAAFGATSAAAIYNAPESQPAARVRQMPDELPEARNFTLTGDGDVTSSDDDVSGTVKDSADAADAGSGTTTSGDFKPKPGPGGPVGLPIAPPPLKLPDLPASEVRAE